MPTAEQSAGESDPSRPKHRAAQGGQEEEAESAHRVDERQAGVEQRHGAGLDLAIVRRVELRPVPREQRACVGEVPRRLTEGSSKRLVPRRETAPFHAASAAVSAAPIPDESRKGWSPPSRIARSEKTNIPSITNIGIEEPGGDRREKE